MKRTGYIFEKICEIDNIKHAIMKASLGKRNQNRVKRVIQNIDVAAARIQKMQIYYSQKRRYSDDTGRISAKDG